MKFICFPALVAGSMFFFVNLAQAQTDATGSLGVSAEVTHTCTLSATPLAFGELSTTGTSTADSVITLVCNGPPSVTNVSVGMGENADSGTQRNMISGTDEVPYTLHVVAGDVTDILEGGVITLVVQTDPTTYSASIYGEIEASTDYPMGSYSDTVVLTAAYGLGA